VTERAIGDADQGLLRHWSYTHDVILRLQWLRTFFCVLDKAELSLILKRSEISSATDQYTTWSAGFIVLQLQACRVIT